MRAEKGDNFLHTKTPVRIYFLVVIVIHDWLIILKDGWGSYYQTIILYGSIVAMVC